MRKFIPIIFSYPLSKSQQYFNHGNLGNGKRALSRRPWKKGMGSVCRRQLPDYITVWVGRERDGLVRNKNEGKKTKIPTKALRGQ